MKRTHGKARTPIYILWQAIKQRCYNPRHTAFSRYGQRGIYVCERWHNFENFMNDIGERPPKYTLDRIDNNGPYSPENCRWATRKEQSNNRYVNVRITHEGLTLTATQWSERLGIQVSTLLSRYHARLPTEKVLSQTLMPNFSGLKLGGEANARRQQARTHCKRGHEYTPKNTGLQFSKKGTPSRYCKACRRV